MADDTEKENVASEENAEANGEEEGSGKSKVKKLILFIGLPLLLLIGGGTGAYFTGLLDPWLPNQELVCDDISEGDEDYELCAAQIAAAADASAPGAFFTIPDLIVNLNSTSKQPRFLKIAMKLELESQEDIAKAEAVMPRIVDQFQTYLRELRVEDLRGSSGIYRLRIELLSRVKAAAPHIEVRDVLFQEILIQ